MSNFAIYMIGSVLVAGALAYAAHLLGLSASWIAVGVIAIIGFGIMGGIRKTRRRETPDKD